MINGNNNSYYLAVKNRSELNSLGWSMAKKGAIINSDINFQNALDDALNYEIIEKDPQRISKLKPYINRHDWERIEFPAGPKEWGKCERNNKTIALNVLYIPHNTKTVSVAYRTEQNNKRRKQEILLMVTNTEKYHYLAVTNLSGLLQGNSSKHEGHFIV